MINKYFFFLENKGFIYIFKGLDYKMCKFDLLFYVYKSE